MLFSGEMIALREVMAVPRMEIGTWTSKTRKSSMDLSGSMRMPCRTTEASIKIKGEDEPSIYIYIYTWIYMDIHGNVM